MNFLGCGHRKKTYGNNLFKKIKKKKKKKKKKIAYQRLYFHPPSFVYMKDIFYVRRKEVFSCLKLEKKFQNWKSWCRSEERNLSIMRKGTIIFYKVEYKQTIPSDYKLVLKYMEQVRSRYAGEVTFICGYKAGCLGYDTGGIC